MTDKPDDDVTAEFDQTNGLAPGLEGDSDGTAEGDERSEAERESDGGLLDGAVPPDPSDR